MQLLAAEEQTKNTQMNLASKVIALFFCSSIRRNRNPVLKNKHTEDIKGHHFQKLRISINFSPYLFPYVPTCEFCLHMSKENPVSFTKDRQRFMLST